ncbi:MAG: pyruvate dehydrogenase (acetyl-transferring) E1 component subunit alpha [Pseudomonadaceae bacterium]|nr:pyruvate dehydrogenase (acetyl-transferring) E1 component subunit alpha [Pseudomonadaceae bacterium]
MLPFPLQKKPRAKVPAKAEKDAPLHERLGLTPDTLEAAYKAMLYARRFQEKTASLYQQQEILGFCHLYIGQEAVAIGTKLASLPGDDFITSYRCHVLALACGLSGEEVLGELTGRTIGISKGKGGSMHMFDPDKRFWGGHGIVAAQVPIGAGLAFAAKYKGEERVCYTFIGDGAMNAGQTFETFNMAALWKLPVVFIIENNHWGMGTSVPRAAAGELYKRGEPFGIPGEKVDGMDMFAVFDAVEKASRHVREGKGPYLLEMDTYRYRGHSMSDPSKYRTREEVEGVREARDPIVRLQKYMEDNLNKSSEWFESIDEKIKKEVVRVAEVATSAPRPDACELWTDVGA